MTATYDLIASNVLTSSASSVTFSSIPATYRDLVLVVDANNNTGNSFPTIRFNGDSTDGNYSYVHMTGNGSSATSGATTSTGGYVGTYISSTTRILFICSVMDYAQTDKHKTFLVRGNNAGLETAAVTNRWNQTTAINQVSIHAITNSFNTGSTFYLYGIVS